MLEAKTENSSNEILFADEMPKANNRTIQPLTEKEAEPDRTMETLDGQGHQNGTVCLVLRDSYNMPVSTIHILVDHASVAISKPKVELESHAEMCVVGDNCFVIHDHNRPVNVYSHDPKDGQRSAKIVDAAVGL